MLLREILSEQNFLQFIIKITHQLIPYFDRKAFEQLLFLHNTEAGFLVKAISNLFYEYRSCQYILNFPIPNKENEDF